MKKCSKCNEVKELTEYHKRANRPCGVRSICKACYLLYPKEKKRRDGYMRNYDLYKSYGITEDDFKIMLKSQNDKCAVCGEHRDNKLTGHKKHLCVDHCHKTGVIRGLLCDKCNRGIGLLGDNVDILKRAIDYMSRTNNYKL